MLNNVIEGIFDKLLMPVFQSRNKASMQKLSRECFAPIVKKIGDNKFMTEDSVTRVDFRYFEFIDSLNTSLRMNVYENFSAHEQTSILYRACKA